MSRHRRLIAGRAFCAPGLLAIVEIHGTVFLEDSRGSLGIVLRHLRRQQEAAAPDRL